MHHLLGRVERSKAMKIKVNGYTYTEFYSFEGGTYFTPDDAIGAEPWVALMADGSVELLINGTHIKTEYTYEIV